MAEALSSSVDLETMAENVETIKGMLEELMEKAKINDERSRAILDLVNVLTVHGATSKSTGGKSSTAAAAAAAADTDSSSVNSFAISPKVLKRIAKTGAAEVDMMKLTKYFSVLALLETVIPDSITSVVNLIVNALPGLEDPSALKPEWEAKRWDSMEPYLKSSAEQLRSSLTANFKNLLSTGVKPGVILLTTGVPDKVKRILTSIVELLKKANGPERFKNFHWWLASYIQPYDKNARTPYSFESSGKASSNKYSLSETILGIAWWNYLPSDSKKLVLFPLASTDNPVTYLFSPEAAYALQQEYATSLMQKVAPTQASK